MKLESLQDLYHDHLRVLHSAEQQIADALPRFAGVAHSQDLRRALEDHHRASQARLARLDQILSRPSPSGP